MEEPFSRTAMLLGEEALERLSRARVALFGLGGVGGYALEALVRGGVGRLDLVDSDTVSVTNLNRQLLATHRTLGMKKVDAARDRALDINPQAEIRCFPVFFGPETASGFDFREYDYVIDAVDTVSAKLLLVEKASAAGTPIISCMGTGNKLDPSRFRVEDLSKTSMCPLARVMRKELGKRGIRHLKVVYSQEEAMTPQGWEEAAAAAGKRQIPGSVSFVPGAAGLLLAGAVIRDLTEKQPSGHGLLKADQ